MLFLRLPAGLTALCLAALARAQDVCYYPGGQLSSDIPCNPEAGTSMCCSSSAACLSSGLCRDTSANSTSAAQFVRATCTDQTWSSDACPPYCVPQQGLSSTTLNLHWTQNNVHIQQCNDSSSAPATQYCCGYVDAGMQCCDQPAAKFELLAAAVPQPQASSPEDCTSSSSLVGGGSPPSTQQSPPISTTESSSSVTTSSLSRTVLTPPLAITSSSTPSSTPTTSIASAETPQISQSVLTSTSTTSSSETLVVSTGLPTATSTSLASTAGSTSSSISASSAFAGALPVPSTSETENSDLGDVGSKDSWPSGLPHMMPPGLSTGKIVGIGLGASVAGAGLVAISVYLWARRRMYKKQQQKWQEQMGGLDRGMTVQTADGEPSMVMLRRPESMASATSASGMMPSMLKPVVMRAGGIEGVVSASSQYSQEPERLAEMDSREAPPSRAGRTATWLGRHSVYEMP